MIHAINPSIWEGGRGWLVSVSLRVAWSDFIQGSLSFPLYSFFSYLVLGDLKVGRKRVEKGGRNNPQSSQKQLYVGVSGFLISALQFSFYPANS